MRRAMDIRFLLRQLSRSLIDREWEKRHRLTQAEIDEFCQQVKDYFATHWRDDDNPEIECKMRRSWFIKLNVGAI